jgi:hypothetical protein
MLKLKTLSFHLSRERSRKKQLATSAKAFSNKMRENFFPSHPFQQQHHVFFLIKSKMENELAHKAPDCK